MLAHRRHDVGEIEGFFLRVWLLLRAVFQSLRPGERRRVHGDAGDASLDVRHRVGREARAALVAGVVPARRDLYGRKHGVGDLLEGEPSAVQPKLYRALSPSHVLQGTRDLRPTQLPEPDEILIALARTPGRAPQPKRAGRLCTAIC